MACSRVRVGVGLSSLPMGDKCRCRVCSVYAHVSLLLQHGVAKVDELLTLHIAPYLVGFFKLVP